MTGLNEESLEALRKAISAKDKLIPFIGSGVSCPLGLPSWHQLIGELAKSANLQAEELPSRPGESVEFIANKLGNQFAGEVQHLLFSDKQVATRVHHVLATSGSRQFVTTNLDSAFEYALKCNGDTDVETICAIEPDWLARFNDTSDRTRLLKLHGTIEDPDTWVLTESRLRERILQGRYDRLAVLRQ